MRWETGELPEASDIKLGSNLEHWVILGRHLDREALTLTAIVSSLRLSRILGLSGQSQEHSAQQLLAQTDSRIILLETVCYHILKVLVRHQRIDFLSLLQNTLQNLRLLMLEL